MGRPIPTVSLYPAAAAFPITAQGRRPHWTFRGLLNVHSRYGLSARCIAQGDTFVSKAPTVSFPPLVASIATGWSDPVAGWDLHPLKTNTFRTAHVESRCDAVVVGSAYLFPALSFAGASLASPCSVSTPRSSNRACSFPAPGFRTRLYLMCCFTRSPTNDCRYVLWSRYSPSFWYRCWSGNRRLP